MKIKLFFRKPRPEYNSLEEVFETVITAFPEDISAERINVPETGASFGTLKTNVLYAQRHRGTLNHITGDIHYAAIGTGRCTVLTIHDVKSVIKGPAVKRFFLKLLWFWIPALIAKRITTISPHSQKELEKIVPFARGKIRVVPNPYRPSLFADMYNEEQGSDENSGWTSEVAKLRQYKSQGIKVVLHLGTKANKNLERTIEALTGLDVHLVIVGKLSGEQTGLLENYKISCSAFFNLPYHQIVCLYHLCDVVSFASLYEGFGMPIIEAQAVGKPVVTSNIEPMNWVAGGAACFVNPLEVKSIRHGLEQVLHKEAYRTDLMKLGKENIKRFEPQRIAEMYLEVYKEIEKA